jgi:hypothetical protein
MVMMLMAMAGTVTGHKVQNQFQSIWPVSFNAIKITVNKIMVFI